MEFSTQQMERKIQTVVQPCCLQSRPLIVNRPTLKGPRSSLYQVKNSEWYSVFFTIPRDLSVRAFQNVKFIFFVVDKQIKSAPTTCRSSLRPWRRSTADCSRRQSCVSQLSHRLFQKLAIRKYYPLNFQLNFYRPAVVIHKRISVF